MTRAGASLVRLGLTEPWVEDTLTQLGWWAGWSSRWPGPVSLPAQAALQSIQLGGCRVLGVPGEMFSEVGREICRCGSQPTLLVGYANDYVGYLVPPGAAPGYESLMSFVTEESAAAVAAALTDAVR